jgi:hypothetical protein
MRSIFIAAGAALLAACGSQDPSEDTGRAAGDPEQPATAAAPASAAPRPDLHDCPARQPPEDGLRQRTEPIPVPAELRASMASEMDNLAVSTLAGGTVCVDASWMEAIHDPRLTHGGRLASFDWEGYESYGHVIVDRSGAGQMLDTGVSPVPSSSGDRFAAADLGEAGYGALNAFAVWQIEATGIRQLALQQEVPSAADWHIERWQGETCVELSAIPWDGYTGDADAARERFRASEAGGWRIEPGRCAAG